MVFSGSKLTTKRVSLGSDERRRRSSSRRLMAPSPRAHSTLSGRRRVSSSTVPSRARIAEAPWASSRMKMKAKPRLRSTRETGPWAEKRRSRSEVLVSYSKLPTKMARGSGAAGAAVSAGAADAAGSMACGEGRGCGEVEERVWSAGSGEEGAYGAFV